MRKLLTDPLFLLGLAVRIGLIVAVTPDRAAIWYAPFMDVTTKGFGLDPWGIFLEQGGSKASFPYGIAMWIALLPLTLAAKLAGAPVLLGYKLSLLVADIALLILFRALFEADDKRRRLLLFYWLSPIPIIANYWFGFNDIIPVALLTLALYFGRRLDMARSGFWCGAAISAKLSMALAVPIFLIYLWRNRPLRPLLPPYLNGLAFAGLVLLAPFALSEAGMNMLIFNPEMQKIYNVTLSIDGRIDVFIVPLAYMLMLYAAWRVRRMNFTLFNSVLGVAFLLVILLTPATPGWFLWVIPLLVFYQLQGDWTAIALASAFSSAYALSALITGPLPGLPFDFDLLAAQTWFFSSVGGYGVSLLQTFMVAIGIALVARLWRQTVRGSTFFRLSQRPFVIGIAGDSGAGKDTLAEALRGLFGTASVASISGDDYHLWDRHKPLWQAVTHLNPMANDLEKFTGDLAALIDGRSILSRHYDHALGKKGKHFTVRSNDVIIVSGLHALYLPMLRAAYDLSIFLDMDEDLRRHLKVQRDVKARGHSMQRVIESINRREADAERFIRPQKVHADLVMSLQPLQAVTLFESGRDGQAGHRLHVYARSGLSEPSLARVLVGLCGLHVDLVMGADAQSVEVSMEGEVDADDIAFAARLLVPDLIEFLDIKPIWHGGTLGLMQLVILVQIQRSLTRRLI